MTDYNKIDQQLDEIITNLVDKLSEALNAVITAAKLVILKLAVLLKDYKNGRVKHLAFYCKKKRTKKKNIHRLLKELSKL